MKRYEILASYYSSSKKKKEEIAKCSIITNSDCGKHKPSNYGWKYKSVLYGINRETKKRKGNDAIISEVQK